MGNSGGSRNCQGRGCQLRRWDANLSFDQIFPENCLKVKEIGPRGDLPRGIYSMKKRPIVRNQAI